jgi:hypothetical protein
VLLEVTEPTVSEQLGKVRKLVKVGPLWCLVLLVICETGRGLTIPTFGVLMVYCLFLQRVSFICLMMLLASIAIFVLTLGSKLVYAKIETQSMQRLQQILSKNRNRVNLRDLQSLATGLTEELNIIIEAGVAILLGLAIGFCYCWKLALILLGFLILIAGLTKFSSQSQESQKWENIKAILDNFK